MNQLTATVLLNDIYPPYSSSMEDNYHLLTIAYHKQVEGQLIWSKGLAHALMLNGATLPHFFKYLDGDDVKGKLHKAIDLKQLQQVAGALSNVILKWDEADVNALACYKGGGGFYNLLGPVLDLLDPLSQKNIKYLFFNDLKVDDLSVQYTLALLIVCSIFRLAGFNVSLTYPHRFTGRAIELVMAPF